MIVLIWYKISLVDTTQPYLSIEQMYYNESNWDVQKTKIRFCVELHATGPRSDLHNIVGFFPWRTNLSHDTHFRCRRWCTCIGRGTVKETKNCQCNAIYLSPSTIKQTANRTWYNLAIKQMGTQIPGPLHKIYKMNKINKAIYCMRHIFIHTHLIEHSPKPAYYTSWCRGTGRGQWALTIVTLWPSLAPLPWPDEHNQYDNLRDLVRTLAPSESSGCPTLLSRRSLGSTVSYSDFSRLSSFP